MARRCPFLFVAAWLLAAACAPAAAAQPAGAALFARHCASCHQADGSGTVGLAPALKGEHWAKLGADRSYLPAILVHGLSGPIKVNGQVFVGSMPAVAELDDATLAALASHVRTLQGASGDAAYTAEEFKAARAQAGSPPQTRARRVGIVGR
jgi:mono/diheme cytochrome c family protein